MNMRRIWVGLLFHNEIELLDVAIRLYAPIVSGIDIVHSNVTLSGRPKPLYALPLLPLNVRVTTITNLTRRTVFDNEDFSRETHSRRVLGRVLRTRVVHDNDCIVVPDLDELIHPTTLQQACNAITHGTVVEFGLMWFYTSMWQLALPNTWNVKAMVTAKTFAVYQDDPGAVRTARHVSRYMIPSIRQCDDTTPIGWHCTWCFPRREQFVQKLRASSHVNYARHARNGRVVKKMMCSGQWLDQGIHGQLRRCHSLPNGSWELLNPCAKMHLLPHKPPPLSGCAKRVVPCTQKALVQACTLMAQHIDERLTIWNDFRDNCARTSLQM